MRARSELEEREEREEAGEGGQVGKWSVEMVVRWGVYPGFAFMRPFSSGMIPTMGGRPAKMESGLVVR